MNARNYALSVVFASLVVPSVTGQQGPWPTRAWPSATPRAVGLDPKALATLDSDIAAGKYGYVDSMLVIRHGQVAYERTYKHDYDRIYAQEARTLGPLNAHDPSGPYNYFNPWWHPFYRRGDLHTMQSVTKTVTSVVIGIAVGRHEFPSLDTPVLTFFDVAKVANVDDRKRRITIRHVLTMTTGLDWNEDLAYADPNNASSIMEASFDWVQFTIDRPMAQEPGKAFQYSSGATQLLSHIFRSTTGKDIEEYAAQHLFAPLGIGRYFWKRSPTGLADTEGGLYLAPRDLAKIAYLYLKNGVWEGRSIVQPDWVKASIAPSIPALGRGDGVMYGFKWWLYPYGTGGTRLAFGGSGLGGQRPIVVPGLDLVIVFTGWNLLPDRPNLTPRVAIDRVLEAVVDDRSGASR
jgi:CubicO group peptidase (beta-lactamase class C family)